MIIGYSRQGRPRSTSFGEVFIRVCAVRHHHPGIYVLLVVNLYGVTQSLPSRARFYSDREKREGREG